ncbi:zinc ABC transporter ATP-binding protein AztA [Streptomyces carpaticus]|uniref:Zinc/manganese transport system ATP-binding protein n=1 Tax=Streptomyces harbinensis TaxID=1176198 RepID=A0A1I6TEV1_9ACTN|nr:MULTISPECIES: zinc ABC transporter ATP-binding protein AztA [Streptomyces]QKV69516.1 metal ABC transporter ATP-binding protein [Streptomyces harbinensis]UWM49910.1 zinc ABC transporter ATP-binding protein AztA [Streptomyces carpaticus]SFS87739.1 zinc/manganese transport system ATP-binding protein [Streptomyces harbinensis]
MPVTLHEVTADYPGHRALHGISATLPAGAVTALTGPNGSGKSTLLNLLAGTLTPTTGTISYGRPCRPAYVVQRSAVPDALPLTVREAVTMGRWAERGPWRRLTRADRAVVDDCLTRLGIADLAHRQLGGLSGGQRQRTLIAQALAQRSPLLLLDEPTAALDAAAQRQITDTLTRIAAEDGTTVVHATHHPAEAAAADHTLTLAAGHLC